MDKPKPPASSLSRSIIRRIGSLSLLIIIGTIIVIVLGLLLTLNQVDATMSEIKIEAASAFDLFFLKIQSDLLATSNGLAEHDDKNSALLALRIRNNTFLDVLFISPDGNILAQRNAVGRPTRTDIEDLEWLMSPPPFGEVAIGPVRFERQTPYVDMAVTATDAIGLPSGILLVRVDLTQLWNKTLDIQVGNSGYAYIVDDSGQLIAFRNRRLLESGSNLHNLVGHTPQEIAASAFNFYTSMTNQPVLAAAQPLKTVSWFAVVEQPVYEALAPFIPVGIAVFFVFAIVVFSLRNTLQFTRTRIVLPLSSLREAVKQMEEGKLKRKIEIRRDDELGQLSEAFNQMASKLQLQTDLLRESEARYRIIFEQSPDGVVVLNPENGQIIEFNDQACRQLGYTRDEFAKLHVADVEEAEAPEEVQRHIDKIVAGGHDEFESLHQTKQGEIRNVQVIAQVIDTGKNPIYHCIWRDITKRKRADEALLESEKKYRSLFENMTSGFAVHQMIYDKRGNPYDYRYLEVNPAFEKLTGFPIADMIGKTIRELMPDTEEYWIQVFGKVAKTGIPTSYMNFAQSLGKYYDTYVFSPEKDRFAVVFNDVTERMQAENQLKEQLDELRRWHQVTIGREDRIIALKHEVNSLLEKEGKPPRYPSADME